MIVLCFVQSPLSLVAADFDAAGTERPSGRRRGTPRSRSESRCSKRNVGRIRYGTIQVPIGCQPVLAPSASCASP